MLEAMGLLQRLLTAAEEGERAGSIDRNPGAAGARPPACAAISPAALAPLERALALAEPEGYVRIFVDEGPAMAALLRAATKRGDRRGLRPSAPGSVWFGRGQNAGPTRL